MVVGSSLIYTISRSFTSYMSFLGYTINLIIVIFLGISFIVAGYVLKKESKSHSCIHNLNKISLILNTLFDFKLIFFYDGNRAIHEEKGVRIMQIMFTRKINKTTFRLIHWKRTWK